MRSRRAQARDVLALDQHRAVGGAELPGHQVEIGRLAGAVRPDDGGELARKESAGDVVDRDMAAEADGQPRVSSDGIIRAVPRSETSFTALILRRPLSKTKGLEGWSSPHRPQGLLARPSRRRALRGSSGRGRKASSLVADRDIHILDFELAGEFGDAPRRPSDRP